MALQYSYFHTWQTASQDKLLPLVAEVVADGHSVLIFCGGRNACENCAGGITALYDPSIMALEFGCGATALCTCK